MKHKHRHIVVNGISFYYWYKELLGEEYKILSNQIMISPKNNKNNKIIIEFIYDNSLEAVYEDPFIYDINHFFAIVGKKENQEVTFDWGKPKAISEIISYVIQSNTWDLSLKKSIKINGWDMLKDMEYSEIRPVISWGF